jgi:DNA-binding NarL/FixJ family response regulator
MNARRHRMLLVEDHQPTRINLRRILSARGWEVLEAATIAEGVAQLDPAPDCIVLDLVLPDGKGEAILRKIRVEQLQVCDQTRVVVNTGLDDPARLSEVSYLRPNAVLQKPVDPERLCRACTPPEPAATSVV